MAAGAAVYQAHCEACHMPHGEGVPGINPPLRDTDWVTGDPERLIRVILEGLDAPIEVHGTRYDSQMPGMAYLADADIAAVLTYIRNSFGNVATPIRAEEVSAMRP